MKKINKRIATALIAAAMFAFTSVAASAADYGNTPSYPTPSVPSTPSDSDVSDSTDDSSDETDEETVVVTDDAVADAIADAENGAATIEASAEEVIVTEAAIGAIASGEVVVTIVTDEYEIEIDPSLIEEVKEIDLTMNITVVDEETDVDDVTVSKNSIVIAPAQSGAFGMTVKVTIPAAFVEGLDTDSLKLYYISDDGDVELIEDDVKVNADGSVSVSISHASKYVITDEDLLASEEDDDVAIEEVEEDDDEEEVEAPADTNPGTGVMLSTAAMLACAAVAVVSKKRK